jgi:hypothetical protein
MRDESEKVSELGDGQKTVLITVGCLGPGLDETQQLALADFAFAPRGGTLMVGCSAMAKPPVAHCPATGIKML